MRYPVRIELYAYGAVEAPDPETAETLALRLNQRLYNLDTIEITIGGEPLHLHFYPDPDETALEVLDPD